MTVKEEKIHIIATGGTIDSKFYAPTESSKVKKNIEKSRFEFVENS